MNELNSTKAEMVRLDTELTVAQKDAKSRLDGIRRVKLGDLNLRVGMYEEMKQIIRLIYQTHELLRFFFYDSEWERQSRRLLLALMSEMVYWEYERSFWRKWYEILELEGKQSDYNWFTRQMITGYKENGIPLIISSRFWNPRREFVRTIIAESGFSMLLVQNAKQFAIWFFDHYSDLDPRALDTISFDQIIDESKLILNKDEIFELLRDMVGAVARLLKEIRKRSLTSADLNDAQVLIKLEEALGFHPVRGIFGFRKKADIQELLEQLSTRVKPDTFHSLLRRKIRTSRDNLMVLTPDNQTINVKRVNDVPIMYGEYRLLSPHQSEIQVVPREALKLSDLYEMLQCEKRVFYHGNNFSWIKDNNPFEVYQGSMEPQKARRYFVYDQSGYMWYGKQKIGIPLKAIGGGEFLSTSDPQRDVLINPRLRLDNDKKGLEIVIPASVFYDPEFAGHTVRLELNRRPMENTTYIINHEGSLKLQSTRTAPVLPEDRYLEVRLISLNDERTVKIITVLKSLNRNLLFNRETRTLINPGNKYYGGDKFVLFATSDSEIEVGEAVESEPGGYFGELQIFNLRWVSGTKDSLPFEVKVGGQQWRFKKPIEINMSLNCQTVSGPFFPEEPGSAFSPEDIQIYLHFIGTHDPVSELWPKLSLIFEKDDEFLMDFSLKELVRLNMLNTTGSTDKFKLHVVAVLKYLVGHQFTDRDLGSYRLLLMFQPTSTDDLESVSEVEFKLLPGLRAEDLRSTMSDGHESIISVYCESPLLADEEDRPVDVLRLDCTPQVEFDLKRKRLKAHPLKLNVRLIYPPTKVKLEFIPEVFAATLLCKNQVKSRAVLTHGEAKESNLLLLSPSSESTYLEGCNLKKEIEVDEDDHAIFKLDQLLPSVQNQNNEFIVIRGEFEFPFQIVWEPKLKFHPEKCKLNEHNGKSGNLVLFYDVDGPPDIEITFNIFDNRFRSLGQNIYTISDLKDRKIELSFDNRQTEDANIIYCVSLVGKERLDSVNFVVKEIIDGGGVSPSDSLSEELKKSELMELPILLKRLQYTGKDSYVQQAVNHMYSIKRFDELYQRRNKLNQQKIDDYFVSFTPSVLPDLTQMPIPKLKKCCALPVPKLQLACAEGLLLQDDGWGVDVIRDLLVDDDISIQTGKKALSKNRDCASQVVRDMVKWDKLEYENDAFINIMVELSKEFHPPMAISARKSKDWKRAYEFLNQKKVFSEIVSNSNEEGLMIPFGMVTGFVPVEEIDMRRHYIKGTRLSKIKQMKKVVGEKIPVIVIKVERRRSKLILSEKRARSILESKTLSEIKVGDVRRGVVTNSVDFGVFVDIGGMDGLIPRSEIDWRKFNHPREVLRIGESVEVVVNSIDRQKKRLDLSRKRLLPSPPGLEKIRGYQVGQIVHGKVKKIKNKGAIIFVDEDIPGFVHRSELTKKSISHPGEILKIGDKLKFRILLIDERKGRLDLSLKQVGEEDLYRGSMRIKTEW